MSLKDNWKKVGNDFKNLGNENIRNLGKDIGKTAVDFSKTMIKTIKFGADKMDEWASGDEQQNENDENR